MGPMAQEKKQSSGGVRAAFVLFGTIVGAGIFGLPYVVERSGYAVGLFWMIVLSGVVALTHTLYGEVVSATEGEHRLIGYVGIHLGRKAKIVETCASILSLTGANLAYLILGGLFLSQLVKGIPPILGATTLFGVGIAAAVGGTKFLASADFFMTLLELGAMALLGSVGLHVFKTANLAGFHWGEVFRPYGVVLFAYGGLSAITEIRPMTRDRHVLRKSIVVGTMMAAALTIFFVTAVLGALGPDITPETVGALNARLGGPVPLIGAVAGFITILTSYIVFGEYLKNQFWRDFAWPKWQAGLVAVGGPFLLYLIGIRSFGAVLELVGSVLVAVEGSFVCLMYLKLRKDRTPGILQIPLPFIYLLLAAYAAGALYELVFRLIK